MNRQKKEIESYQNGKWIPNSKIGASLFDAHYMLGIAVFEALRTYNHKLFLLEEHLDRLYKSINATGINFSMSKDEMKKIIQEVVNRNKDFFPSEEEYRMMVYVSPGTFKIYDDIMKTGSILTINVTQTSRYAKFMAPYLDKGVTALISSQRQIPSRFLDPKIKNCSRLHYWLADAEAGRAGDVVTPILLDEHGHISESSGSNVLFMRNDEVYLPNENDILGGCTLNFVKGLLKKLDIATVYGKWETYHLLDADAILFTSTFQGLIPCYSIIYRNKKYPLNKSNDTVIERVFEEFSMAVDVDIKKQWRDWYEWSKDWK